MRNRFGLIAALIGGLMIVGTAFLPIDPAAVRLRSVESLVRDGLKQLKPADGSPPLAVQVRLEGVPEATTERLQIWLPRGRGGYRLEGFAEDVIQAV